MTGEAVDGGDEPLTGEEKEAMKEEHGGAPPGDQSPPGVAGQPSEEELRAAFEEQLRRIRVEDVLVQTAVTLVNLAGRRMGLPGPEGEPDEPADLQQARLAIDASRALVPMLPAEPQRAVRDALSQLQMAYVRSAGPGEAVGGQPGAPSGAPAGSDEATKEGGSGAPGGQSGTPSGAQAGSDEAIKGDDQAEAERAKARSKIWTPPGT